jgi:23S rRNA-/tRNA-specific pseudouridylate synthase
MIDRARLGLVVLRESDADLVVVKPAGVASELSRDPRNESLISRVRLSAPQGGGVSPRLVHRLDRVTRGIMVVALTKEAAAFHGEQIKEGTWEKYYLARIPTPKSGTAAAERLVGKHKAYISEDGDRAKLVRSGGKPSFLEVLAWGEAPGRAGQSQVMIRLLTGRLHQIRVMFAGLGLPLIGDTVYGGPGLGKDFYLEHAALWHKDASNGQRVLAFVADDPERERLNRGVEAALRKVTEVGSGT